VPHQSLAAHLEAVPVTPPTTFDILGWLLSVLSAWMAAVKAFVIQNADPRKLIDTPEERSSLEKQAIDGFDKMVRSALAAKFGDMLTAGFLAGVEPELVKMLDLLFVALSATLPPSPPPAPPVPVAVVVPTGSAAS